MMCFTDEAAEKEKPRKVAADSVFYYGNDFCVCNSDCAKTCKLTRIKPTRLKGGTANFMLATVPTAYMLRLPNTKERIRQVRRQQYSR